jgi:hypothetical protein
MELIRRWLCDWLGHRIVTDASGDYCGRCRLVPNGRIEDVLEETP